MFSRNFGGIFWFSTISLLLDRTLAVACGELDRGPNRVVGFAELSRPKVLVAYRQ